MMFNVYLQAQGVTAMNTSKIHGDFNGYGGYPLSEGEHIIRARIMECMNGLREKNDICLEKARSERREKLLSQILSIKKRMDRISDDMKKSMEEIQYRFEKISETDEAAIRAIDRMIEENIVKCSEVIDSLECSNTDMHIADRYAHIMEGIGNVEKLFHDRMKIFKRMQVYG
jgi:hypothetical protein